MKTHESGKARKPRRNFNVISRGKKDNEKEEKKKISSQKRTVSKGRFPKKSQRFQRSASRKKINEGITQVKVIGVGGAGGNIVTRMKEKGRMKGVEYIAVNTDAQDLNIASVHRKIYIGKALTKGLGAGMNPNIGKQAIEENRSEIGEVVKGADIVFITAGFGGGTGSGAAPVIAEIAKREGILTIGIITKPFKFEGSKRMAIAQEAINKIRDNVDALVVVPNERIFLVISKDTSIIKAFAYVDDVLRGGVEAITDLINTSGIINVDFSDIEAVLQDMGTSMIGVGVAKGQDRSAKAVEQAINSPLLETTIEGAKKVLFLVAGGRDLKMLEVNDIAKVISSKVDPDAEVIFGASHDQSLRDGAIKVTVIAAGFNMTMEPGGGSFGVPQLFSNQKRRKEMEINPLETEEEKLEKELGEIKEPLKPKSKDSNSNPWDIPTFLRKKKK